LIFESFLFDYRLVELGPRLTLELIKIEEGIMNGEVLFHSFIKKTKAQVKELKLIRQQKTHLKFSRKRQQELNVKRKREAKDKKIDENEDNDQTLDNDNQE